MNHLFNKADKGVDKFVIYVNRSTAGKTRTQKDAHQKQMQQCERKLFNEYSSYGLLVVLHIIFSHHLCLSQFGLPPTDDFMPILISTILIFHHVTV